MAKLVTVVCSSAQKVIGRSWHGRQRYELRLTCHCGLPPTLADETLRTGWSMVPWPSLGIWFSKFASPGTSAVVVQIVIWWNSCLYVGISSGNTATIALPPAAPGATITSMPRARANSPISWE